MSNQAQEATHTMRKLLLSTLAVAALAVPATATAAPAEVECRQAVLDFLVAGSEEGTRGDYMSDGLFGNEPNIENPFAEGGPAELEPGTKAGRVVPSLTPGPATMGGGFYTGGELQRDIRAFCNA